MLRGRKPKFEYQQIVPKISLEIVGILGAKQRALSNLKSKVHDLLRRYSKFGEMTADQKTQSRNLWLNIRAPLIYNHKTALPKKWYTIKIPSEAEVRHILEYVTNALKQATKRVMTKRMKDHKAIMQSSKYDIYKTTRAMPLPPITTVRCDQVLQRTQEDAQGHLAACGVLVTARYWPGPRDAG